MPDALAFNEESIILERETGPHTTKRVSASNFCRRARVSKSPSFFKYPFMEPAIVLLTPTDCP